MTENVTQDYIFDEQGELAVDGLRVLACWNACQGIPTEALDAGAIQQMVKALRYYANGKNWEPVDIGIGTFPKVAFDCGARAEEALAPLDKEIQE